MFLFFKIGLLTCGIYLAFCLLFDFLWLTVGLLFFGEVTLNFVGWWAYFLTMVPLWLFACWLAFRVLFAAR
jgi:hypothetical protein